MEPTDQMQPWQSTKKVLAGRITEVVEAGCYVENMGGETILRIYPENMTARYTPVVGDYWVVYPDQYQSLSPRAAFEDGYVAL
jgi:hypothetical protein